LLLIAGAATAASLTDNDLHYLSTQYGMTESADIIRGLSDAEQAKLHALIIDPIAKQNPKTRDHNVADYLFEVHMRQCSEWALTHGGPECPPTADANAEPGKEIADRQCNACHLFGTFEAPPFRKLAVAGTLTEKKLADALGHGHAMSPITLAAAQLSDLLIYIRSLR